MTYQPDKLTRAWNDVDAETHRWLVAKAYRFIAEHGPVLPYVLADHIRHEAAVYGAPAAYRASGYKEELAVAGAYYAGATDLIGIGWDKEVKDAAFKAVCPECGDKKEPHNGTCTRSECQEASFKRGQIAARQAELEAARKPRNVEAKK